MKQRQNGMQRVVWGAIVGAALFSPLARAQEVKTDYDHNAEFTRYHSYSIAPRCRTRIHCLNSGFGMR